jgi:hypothetical protein
VELGLSPPTVQTVQSLPFNEQLTMKAAKTFSTKAIKHQGQPPKTITLDNYAASHQGRARNEDQRPAAQRVR